MNPRDRYILLVVSLLGIAFPLVVELLFRFGVLQGDDGMLYGFLAFFFFMIGAAFFLFYLKFVVSFHKEGVKVARWEWMLTGLTGLAYLVPVVRYVLLVLMASLRGR